MRYRVLNVSRNTQLADRARRADSFFTRFKGLMGVTVFEVGDGLHIVPCTSVHTFFMKLPIDVIFLDANSTVVDVARALLPWRVSRVYFQARSVLEVPAGVVEGTGTQIGDRITFESSPA